MLVLAGLCAVCAPLIILGLISVAFRLGSLVGRQAANAAAGW